MRLLKSDRLTFLRRLGLPGQDAPVGRRLRCKTRVNSVSNVSSSSSAPAASSRDSVDAAQSDDVLRSAWRIFDDMG